ncbi:MAG: twin-arginine translocase TatA/TatE family subunit, partial [Spirochaetota bacterium]
MFGIGFWEIVIIFLIVIVFVRPSDLPKLVRKLGHLYRQVKDFNQEVMAKIREIEDEVKQPFDLKKIGREHE